MSSDFERAQILLAVVATQPIDGVSRPALIQSAESIQSDHERNRSPCGSRQIRATLAHVCLLALPKRPNPANPADYAPSRQRKPKKAAVPAEPERQARGVAGRK